MGKKGDVINFGTCFICECDKFNSFVTNQAILEDGLSRDEVLLLLLLLMLLVLVLLLLLLLLLLVDAADEVMMVQLLFSLSFLEEDSKLIPLLPAIPQIVLEVEQLPLSVLLLLRLFTFRFNESKYSCCD